jgi:hypothetical protein
MSVVEFGMGIQFGIEQCGHFGNLQTSEEINLGRSKGKSHYFKKPCLA